MVVGLIRDGVWNMPGSSWRLVTGCHFISKRQKLYPGTTLGWVCEARGPGFLSASITSVPGDLGLSAVGLKAQGLPPFPIGK